MILKKITQTAGGILKEIHLPALKKEAPCFGITHQGLKRENNEDAFLIVDRPLGGIDIERSGRLYVVADGMGGHAAGEVASRMACEEMLSYYRQKDAALMSPLERLSQAIRKSDQKISTHAGRNPGLSGMGTTVTAMVVQNRKALIAHVGDSRIYVLRQSGLRQLTKDHTQVQQLLDMGRITEEEARDCHLKHIITQAVGTPKGYQEAFVHEEPVYPGERFLLCSDGLNDMVEDGRIGLILKESRSPRQACEKLIAKALDKGGRDNVTVICVFI